MNVELLKKRIQRGVDSAVEEFQKREDITTKFDKPIVAYIDPDDVRFDMLFARGLNGHPKDIYRPGKCLVLHYTPYAKEVAERNEESPKPTKEWQRAYIESLWLAMKLNSVIKEELRLQGRLTSNLNTMVEWDPETCQEKWSHKLAAAIGGMGTMGPAGSLIVDGRYGGRVGGIITDGLYAEPAEAIPEEKTEKALDDLLRPCLYEGPCTEEMIAACPGKAISETGIDKFKCQEYCQTLDKEIPMPEVCGKCFKFGIK